MSLADLSTPCLLVEQKRLQSNISRMQARADREDVAVRPHTKTHKSIAIAERQKRAGARGITVAKPAEAEIFAKGGFDDIRLAYTVVGDEKHRRLQHLRSQGINISFCVDTFEGARKASAIYADYPPVDVLIEIDVGQGRCGVPYEAKGDVAELARDIERLPGLSLSGILTHAGQAYYGPNDDETPVEALWRVSQREIERMLTLATALRDVGIEQAQPDQFEISVGSTPTTSYFQNREIDGFRVTEIRPGNYVYFDAMQVTLGSCQLTDCALTALATVISKRGGENGSERLYLDAGKKVFTSDKGYLQDYHGVLLEQVNPPIAHGNAAIHALSEEHAWVQFDEPSGYDVGDRVRIVPNHACTAVHTQDKLILLKEGNPAAEIAVDARWAST